MLGCTMCPPSALLVNAHHFSLALLGSRGWLVQAAAIRAPYFQLGLLPKTGKRERGK